VSEKKGAERVHLVNFFSDVAWAPYVAASSVALNTLRILAIGVGIFQDDAAVKAMTRNGNPR
jgi:hypothetical protein